jgi:hypothetical protein
MAAALSTIDAYRRGDPAQARLGDGSAILPQFDAHRDGRAGERMRDVVEELATVGTAQRRTA